MSAPHREASGRSGHDRDAPRSDSGRFGSEWHRHHRAQHENRVAHARGVHPSSRRRERERHDAHAPNYRSRNPVRDSIWTRDDVGVQVSRRRSVDERPNQRRLGNGQSQRTRHRGFGRRGGDHGAPKLLLRAASQGDSLGVVSLAHQGVRHDSFVREARRLQRLGQQGGFRRHRRHRRGGGWIHLLPRCVRKHSLLDAASNRVHHHRVRSDENGQLDSIRRRAHHRPSFHAR